jgi:hypothetical protein
VNIKEVSLMFERSKMSLMAAVILVAASTALAKDSGLPRLDMETACHASQKAVAAILTVENDIFGSCMSDEKDAHDQLDMNWATYPASDKARCIQPKEYMPGYVEWLTCLEMVRDVKALRKGQPGPAVTPDKCPVVRYLDDGTILSVIAC